MKTKLYVIPLSHPAIAARLMLERKGIDHSVVELLSGFHRWTVRAWGFPDGTVPALRIDGRRVQGSRRISRVLDEVVPEPPLFPQDPDRRRRVEEAERWGESELQPVPRRLARWALARDSGVRRRLVELNGLPFPRVGAMAILPLASYFARLSGADDATVRDDLSRLPATLDRVDRLIEQGTIGGDQPNAADFQIAPSVRLLLTFPDLRERVDDRPAADLARRLVPEYPDELPLKLPSAWLPSR